MISGMTEFKGKVKYGTYLYPPVAIKLERLIDLYGLKYAVVNAAIEYFAALTEDQQLAALRQVKQYDPGPGTTTDAQDLGQRLNQKAADLAPSKTRRKKR